MLSFDKVIVLILWGCLGLVILGNLLFACVALVVVTFELVRVCLFGNTTDNARSPIGQEIVIDTNVEQV